MSKKIDITKVKTTRDGSKVLELFRVQHLRNYQLVGVVESYTGARTLESWTESGKYIFDSPRKHCMDLVEWSPYDGWEIDDKIWVRHEGAEAKWTPRHFAGVDSLGNPLTWEYGRSSFSGPGIGKVTWKEARLASEFTPGPENQEWIGCN